MPISIYNEVYTHFEAFVYIDGVHVGWAQNIAINVSYTVQSYDKGRNSPDVGYLLKSRDITVNVGSIVSRGDRYYDSGWQSILDNNVRLKDVFKLDSTRQDNVTIAFLIVHEDNLTDIYDTTPCCTTPDGNFVEDGVEIVGKFINYNIKSSENDLILDNIVFKGERINWYDDDL